MSICGTVSTSILTPSLDSIIHWASIRPSTSTNSTSVCPCAASAENMDVVTNNTDLAAYVGADLEVMRSDTLRMRSGVRGLKPFVMTNLKTHAGLGVVGAFIEGRGMWGAR